VSGWRQHPLLKRLPLLLMVAGAVWLLPTLQPRDVTLALDFPRHVAGLTGYEVVVRDLDGHALRTSLRQGRATAFEEKLSLPRGTYVVQVTFRQGEQAQRVELPLVVGDAERVDLTVP
jgi:hypothetical protein